MGLLNFFIADNGDNGSKEKSSVGRNMNIKHLYHAKLIMKNIRKTSWAEMCQAQKKLGLAKQALSNKKLSPPRAPGRGLVSIGPLNKQKNKRGGLPFQIH